MADLSKLEQLLQEDAGEEGGSRQPQPQQQQQSQQQQQESPGLFRQMTKPYHDSFKSIMGGIADVTGLAHEGAEALRAAMGYEEETALPDAHAIRQSMSEFGMSWESEDQPEDTWNRFMQNLGAGLYPIAGTLGKSTRVASAMVPEIKAALGGAIGGQAVEATEWGQDNPHLARAVGEMGGGIGATMSIPKVVKGAAKLTPIGLTTRSMRGAKAKKRAVKSIKEHADAPESALQRLDEAIAEGMDLTELSPAQMTGDKGLMSLRRGIEKSEGVSSVTTQAGNIQRSRTMDEMTNLLRQGKASKEDLFRFVDNTYKQRAQEAQNALKHTARTSDPTEYQVQIRKNIERTYDETRKAESVLWENLPEGQPFRPERTLKAFYEEVTNITRGGDFGEIDKAIQRKLGNITKTGKVKGGELINAKHKTATPKEMHQLYSTLGRRVRALSNEGGAANKVRILNRMRSNILQDLEESGVAQEYQDAIAFSKRLNEKFTDGDLGKILGFKRGAATKDTRTLDELIGSGGENARYNIKQILDAAPGSEADVKNYLRSRFIEQAAPQGGHINTKAGNKFLQHNNRVLKAFPDLENELNDAVSKQISVDEMAGAPQPKDISPITREKSVAALYLNGEDPGNAIDEVLFSGKRGNITRQLKQMRGLTAEDDTGTALNGLKDGVVERLLHHSRIEMDEPVTAEKMISGKRFLSRFGQIRTPLKKSGVMNEEELKRIDRIGSALKQVEKERGVTPATKIATDKRGQLVDLLARSLGAGLGGFIGSRTPVGTTGGSIMYAQEGSKLGQKIANSLVKDDAKNLLIEAVKDKDTMRRLLQNANQMTEEQQMRWLDWAKQKSGAAAREAGRTAARAPVDAARSIPGTAAAPAVVSATERPAQTRGSKIDDLLKDMGSGSKESKAKSVKDRAKKLEQQLFGE